MFELLFLFGLLFVGGFVVVGLLKFLVAMVLLPVKAAFWLTKGLAGLLIGIPVMILCFVVFIGAFPVAALLLVLPIVVCAVAVGALARLFFFC